MNVTTEFRFKVFDQVRVKPEGWYGQVIVRAPGSVGDGPRETLYLVNINGQRRGRWCRESELEERL